MGSKIGRTPSWDESASARPSSSALHYLPAALVTLLLAGFVVVAGSHWGESAWYLAFARAAGAPPPSPSTVIVSAGGGNADAGRFARLTAAVFAQGPAAVAVGPLPAGLHTDGGSAVLPSGPLVLAHPFARLKAWSFPENGPPAYPTILSRSLYPALDGPEPGLSLPMGEGLDLSDTLITTGSEGSGAAAPTTGFVVPASAGTAWAVPAFVRLERGVSASLGVEAARRFLGVPAMKIGYVEGVGALFDARHSLPIDAAGIALPRLHADDGIPHASAARILEGLAGETALRGKLVFIDPGGAPVHTAAGPRTPTEIQASLAAGLLDGTLIAAPGWGPPLAVIAGLFLAALAATALIGGFGGAWGFALATILASLYPIAAFAAYAKASLWLPPQVPPLLVAAAYLPLAFTRRRIARRRARPPAIPPAPAFDPVLMPHSRPTGQPLTPFRGTPQVAASAATAPPPPRPRPVQRERQAVPEGRPAVPRSMPQAPLSTAPAEARPAAVVRPAPLAQAPIAPAAAAPAAAAPAAAAPASAAGDEIERDAKGGLVRVGKYRIVRKMGFGSAGDVFEGFDTQMGRKVAIKTITRFAANRFDRAAERFVLEARAAGALNHPCINTIYDFGTIRDVSYMVLEFLDGVTLSQWMRAHPQPPHPREAARWIRQIASALDFAHGHKIIHRDLKPANLMVVDNGATLKLLDFGIAKMDDMGLTATGMTVGTPSYMSPEQLAGAKVGPASDLYGFAVVIYQLLTYRLPYIGTKIPELCNRILKNEIVPIGEVNPALDGAYWQALRKAMAMNQEDRYPNCMALCAALEEAMPA
jgi:eukaryotic-like serine/threonine-protein kinase